VDRMTKLYHRLRRRENAPRLREAERFASNIPRNAVKFIPPRPTTYQHKWVCPHGIIMFRPCKKCKRTEEHGVNLLQNVMRKGG
jgi:hypothetical protein